MTPCSHRAWTTPSGLPTCPQADYDGAPSPTIQSGNTGESTAQPRVSSIRESTCPVVFIVAEHTSFGTVRCRFRRHEARTIPIEGVPPVDHELLYGHGRAIADDLNEVVRALEDAVLVVDGDVAQVLDQVGRRPQGSQPVRELLDADGLIRDGDPECSRSRLGDPVVVHLDRAVPRIDLAGVWLRLLEDGGDHVRLTNRGDGSVSAVSEGKAEHALVSLTAPPPVDPFGEKRRPQVGGEHRSGVEQALGEPVLPRLVAGGLSACGDLRHVDDR